MSERIPVGAESRPDEPPGEQPSARIDEAEGSVVGVTPAVPSRAASSWRDHVAQRGWDDGLPFGGAPQAPIGGVLKAAPEDFLVDEVPAYLPCGAGEHVYLRVRKRGLNTMDVARQVAAAFEVTARDVGYAGMKDRQAVSSQWLSVHCREDPAAPLARLAEQTAPSERGSLEVLEISRHRNKLRTGHLRGNLFTITLRETAPVTGELLTTLEAAVERVRLHGFPNYFGAQRFGRDGTNVADGLRMLAGGLRAQGNHRRLLVSAIQSAVFNLYAGMRIEEYGAQAVMLGDVLRRSGSHRSFVCSDPELDGLRLREGELEVTGPMPGPKCERADGESARLEVLAASAVGISEGARHDKAAGGKLDLARAGRLAQGTRRAIMVRPNALGCEVLDDARSVVFSFELPPGSYATVLLRELVRANANGG